MKKLLKVLGIIVITLIVCLGGIIAYLNFGFPDVDAAPTLSIESNEAMIARGAYLANHVAVCTDCHSTRDWTKFAGPITPGTEGMGGEVFDEKMGLPGTFYSKNITPHGLSDWTDGEIYRLITTGVTKYNEPIFNIMPYSGYSKMVPEDVKAIIAYLRTLPAIENEVPASDPQFPVNLIMRTMPKKAEPFTLNKNMSLIEKGKYLVSISGCGDCHTPIENGTPIDGMYMAGGFEFGLPKGGTVRSANITPDEDTGIGHWTSEAFVNRFKMYADSNYIPPTVEENSFNTVMPWIMYAKMEEEDLEAIFTYLQTVEPVKNKVVKFTPDKTPI